MPWISSSLPKYIIFSLSLQHQFPFYWIISISIQICHTVSNNNSILTLISSNLSVSVIHFTAKHLKKNLYLMSLIPFPWFSLTYSLTYSNYSSYLSTIPEKRLLLRASMFSTLQNTVINFQSSCYHSILKVDSTPLYIWFLLCRISPIFPYDSLPCVFISLLKYNFISTT